jgi:hypothetical protein
VISLYVRSRLLFKFILPEEYFLSYLLACVSLQCGRNCSCCMLGLLFDHEAGDSTFLQKVSKLVPGCMLSHPRTLFIVTVFRALNLHTTSLSFPIHSSSALYLRTVCLSVYRKSLSFYWHGRIGIRLSGFMCIHVYIYMCNYLSIYLYYCSKVYYFYFFDIFSSFLIPHPVFCSRI